MRLSLNVPVPIPVTVVRDDLDWLMLGFTVLAVVVPVIIYVLQAHAARRNDEPVAPEQPSDLEPGAPPRLIEAHRCIPPGTLGGCVNCCWCCPRRIWPPVTRPGCSR